MQYTAGLEQQEVSRKLLRRGDQRKIAVGILGPKMVLVDLGSPVQDRGRAYGMRPAPATPCLV